MSDPTRDRIAAAFERELARNPVPPALRTQSVRGAVIAPRQQSGQPRLLALVAALLAFAVVATLVVVSHGLRSNPVPAKPGPPPPPRAEAATAYDQAHGTLVLFGGNGTSVFKDTWTWDGKSWTLHHPAVSPAPRRGAVMAYDAPRHDAVLFGGMAQVGITAKAGQAPVDDTWTWNGMSWQERHPAHEPAFGFDWPATMEFDPVSQTVLLYGFTSRFQAQTWSWNGADWTQVATSAACGASVCGAPAGIGTLASDGHRLLLLAPSFGQVGGRYITQTWAWDGAGWKLLDPTVNLPSLGFPSAAYDAQRHQLVVLTGDTWTWDGSTWSRQHPAVQPPAAGYMVYMSSLREVVSWGDRFSAQNNQMYAWDGANWKLIEPGTVAPNNGKGGAQAWTTPVAAEQIVRASMTTMRPVLVPQSLPGAFEARPQTSPDSFTIDYQSDLRDKTITLSVNSGPNPPPATDPHASLASVTFRGVGAQYQVYDSSSPLSMRWLMWSEPGTIANSIGKAPGLPYFLATSGLTDQEFWQLADSLK